MNQEERNPVSRPQYALATRSNLQLGRRLFHFANGAIVATLYHLFLTHQQIVAVVGLLASALYVFEQVRIAYPELGQHFRWPNQFLLRAEEQLKESAAVPYTMALLLTILTFPKPIAIIAIYTLAIADPMSAIVGITFGKHRFAANKSLEGSAAFFVSCFLCTLLVLLNTPISDISVWSILAVSFWTGFFCCLMEMIPLRIDDNLTIPLYTAIISWCLCSLYHLHISHL